MTAPRQVLPGSIYLVTRRCAQRQYLLRPSKTTNDVLRYVLAVAAQRHGIRLHACCVLSNHMHIVLSDPCAQLPRFHQFVDALVARVINSTLGRWESFWAPGSYSAVRLESSDDVLARIVYTLANPVLNGLVRNGRIWPGVWSAPEIVGAGAIEVRRPDLPFFSKKRSTLPAKATLELTLPPGFSSVEEFRRRVLTALEAEEKQAQERLGDRFMGVAAVEKQKPTGRPRSIEPRRGLNPRVAARDKWRRIEALARVKAFQRNYREALATYREAVAMGRQMPADVLFPAGTYLMRVAHGVRCAGAG